MSGRVLVCLRIFLIILYADKLTENTDFHIKLHEVIDFFVGIFFKKKSVGEITYNNNVMTDKSVNSTM